jgi:hypothetical protein
MLWVAPKLSNRFKAAWRVLLGKATVYRVSFVQLENAVQIKAWKEAPNNITGYDCYWEFMFSGNKFKFIFGERS